MQVKGIAVQSIPLFVKGMFGAKKYQQWLAHLSDAVKTTFSATIPAHAWLPLNAGIVEPVDALCALFYEGKPDGAVELGRFAAEYGLREVLKPHGGRVSPDLLMSKVDDLLSLHFQPCAMEVVDKSQKSATVRITRFDTPHPLVEHAIKGWIETMWAENVLLLMMAERINYFVAQPVEEFFIMTTLMAI